MRRSLEYAKPYWGWFSLAIGLLLGITALELIRPLLVGKAIDDYINGYDMVYSMVEDSESFTIQGYSLLPDPTNYYQDVPKARIIYGKEKYFLIPHLSQKEVETIASLEQGEASFVFETQEGQNWIQLNGKSFLTIPLQREDMKVLRKKDFTGLLKISLLFLLVLLGGLLLGYIQTLILQYTGQKIIYNIRLQVFSHVQTLSLSFFDQNPVGRLVTRVTNDTEALNEMYTSVLVNLFKNIFMLVGILVMMLRLHVKLSLITFAVIPIIVAVTFLFRNLARKTYREIRGKLSKINAFLSEHLSGMKIVQIFAQEEEKFKEFNEINEDLKDSSMREIILFGIFRPIMYFLFNITLCLALGVGGLRVMEGSLSIGVLFAFIQYVALFFNPIQELAEQFNILQSAMAASERIFMLLDEEPAIQDLKQPVDMPKIQGQIEFKNVWFAYEGEDWVLRDVSFTVEPGETVAFVGATGAGKTSILNLLSRYYEIQKGEILIDGVNIQKMSQQQLRSHIGLMLQDVFLFTGDITSNIRLNEERISDETVQQSAQYVNAHSFIEKLPGQYKEPVRERGATLSSGQRQLLSFARTLAFDPKILILDEATANIDTETEQLIQDGLVKLMEGRTTLVVAHRLSTIQHADHIIVLHKGKVREKGNHQELLKQKGIYYRLYQLQYQ
ncbi:MAG: ABC transporter ATP-binding protein [Epulopiscium sp.]|nr:ABC transporter ATP-binding protein [Candidatus Epulonipiscium sp.]